MPRKRVDKNVLDAVIRYYGTGKTLNECARIVGFNVETIRGNLKKIGWRAADHKPHRVPHNAINFDRAEMLKRYVSGDSMVALSNHYGVDRKTIKGCLERDGVPVRSRSEANVNRFRKLSDDERKQITKAANNACRGVAKTNEVKMNISNSRMRNQTHKGFCEDILSQRIRKIGGNPVPQYALGVYNIDVLAFGNIAVEISTRTYDAFKSKWPEKLKQIKKAGMTLIYIHITCEEAGFLNMDNIVSDIQAASRLPSMGREDRVVSCSVKRFTRMRDDRGCFAAEPCPIEPIYRTKT